jgi:3-oxoacyl-(acyl-carrier-protein) synthase
MIEPISIMAMSSVSALGADEENIWNSYQSGKSLISPRDFGQFSALVSSIDKGHWYEINTLRETKQYKELDPSVLLAIHVSKKAVDQAGWKSKNIGINIGSSRGSTHLFEKFHRDFLDADEKTASTLSSPTTTLGNLSSWVGHELQTKGPTISHSIACSTALHAVLNGIAWLNSGMSDFFLSGGSEASNTPFTLAQLKALRIYAEQEQEFPSRTLDPNKRANSMVLGEAASVFCLEKGHIPKALAFIEGVGYATEPLTHNISISSDADCFQRSMVMALNGSDPSEVDAIVTHAPGTLKGDSSELSAIHKVFDPNVPALTSNKWIIGHTLGASGAMSLEMAVLMLNKQEFIGVPFLENQPKPEKIDKIMVNAVGFGGNAVSLLVSRNITV